MKSTFFTAMVLAVLCLLCFPGFMYAQSCSAPNYIEQRFPVNTSLPEETRWRFCWRKVAQNGLVINDAFFRTSPSSPWVKVIFDARVAELFVPYHRGSPRFLDMSGFSFELYQLTPKHCPTTVGGVLLGNSFVCKEVRDRGPAWTKDGLNQERFARQVRRGEELVLWGVLGAGNYHYIIEWTFRDDGAMLGRMGATATNLPSAPMEAHMHGVYWRLDIDLNGSAGDSVHLNSHVESGQVARDTSAMVSRESSYQWDPLGFTSLHIQDSSLKNARGNVSGYHLMPLRTGTPRHQEPFTKHDFWITRYKGTEMLVPSLLNYMMPAEPVSSSDVVVWHYSATHHAPRDEDGEYVNNVFRPLAAHIMWAGFMLKPHNLFNKMPLYP